MASELKAFGQELPAAYGGKGRDVKEGLTVKYATAEKAKAVEPEESAIKSEELARNPTDEPAAETATEAK